MSHARPQQIVYGEGAQTLYFVPVDYRNAKPTRVLTCTYTIVDTTEGTTSASREVVASTAATPDSASDATDAAAGRSTATPSVLSVSDASAFTEGRTYLISDLNDDGDRETFVVRSANATANDLTATREITGTYVSGALVRGIEFSATFPSSIADDEDLAIQDGRQYEIRWSYTIDGRDHVIAQPIDIQRNRLIPWATPEDLFRRCKHLKNRASEQEITDKLMAATEHVIAEIEGSGRHAETYRGGLDAMMCVIFDAAYMLFDDMGSERDAERAATYRERYKAQIHKLTEQRNAGAHFVNRHDDEKRAQLDKLDLFQGT